MSIADAIADAFEAAHKLHTRTPNNFDNTTQSKHAQLLSITNTDDNLYSADDMLNIFAKLRYKKAVLIKQLPIEAVELITALLACMD